MEELYGYRAYKISPLGHGNLSILSKNTEQFGMPFETWLLNHTLFPFYALFSTEESREKKIIQLKEGRLSNCASLTDAGNKWKQTKQLRFCPMCAAEEREQNGDAYWHRLFQIPEMQFCPKHGTLLRSVTVLPRQLILPPKDQPIACVGTASFEGKSIQLQNDIAFCLKNTQRIREDFAKCGGSFVAPYLYLLAEKGLASSECFALRPNFTDAFRRYFGNDMLRSLRLDAADDQRPWFISLCRRGRTNTDPIQHLLMMQFLSGGIEGFLEFVENSPVEFSNERKRISYSQSVDPEKRDRYRERWISATERAKERTINKIADEDRPAYTWLLRHDKKWLRENSPKSLPRGGNITGADWESRDRYYAAMVPGVVRKILSESGKPQRLAQSIIFEAMGAGGFLNDKQKLPNTFLAVDEAVKADTTERFRKRKIRWAIEEFRKTDQALIPWQILKRAGISDKFWDKYRSYVDWLISAQASDNSDNWLERAE